MRRQTLSFSGFRAIAWLASFALFSSGCIGEGEEWEGMEACEVSHHLRTVIDHYEAVAKLAAEKRLAGETPDGPEMVSALARELHQSLPKDFRMDVVIYFFGNRFSDWRYFNCESVATAQLDDVECAELFLMTFDEINLHFYMEYGASQAQEVRNRLYPKQMVCKPGVEIVKQPDGSVVAKDVPCASRESKHVKLEGYDEAMELFNLFEALASIDHTLPSWEQEVLALTEQVRTNGIAAYLGVKCAADEAFAFLQNGGRGRDPRRLFEEGTSGERSITEGLATFREPRRDRSPRAGVAI